VVFRSHRYCPLYSLTVQQAVCSQDLSPFFLGSLLTVSGVDALGLFLRGAQSHELLTPRCLEGVHR